MRRTWAAVAVLLAAMTVTGCGERPTPVAAPPAGSSSADPTDMEIGGEPAPSPSAAPSPRARPTTTRVPPSPTPRRSRPPATGRPTRKAVRDTVVPPAVPRPAPAGCKPTYRGKAVPRATVARLLTDAAGRRYWPGSAPGLTVPVDLVKAVAWQESGWQSHIVACDGGIGLMQVMPDTAAFVNNRFDQSYDINTPADNATLGANYLAWLVKYFGDVYFKGDYRLSATGSCARSTDLCLLNAVVAAYNYGFAKVDTPNGLVIPNRSYVANVRALMTGCVCLSY